MCVATRTVRPVADLIRFVVGPDGEAVPDLKRKLPGRGVWVTATQDALGDAIKRKVFARGFKREVRLPADLRRPAPSTCSNGRRSMRWRSPARRRLVGHRLRQGGGGAGAMTKWSRCMHAAEAAPDGVRKLDAALRRRPSGRRPIAVIRDPDLGAIGFGTGPPKCDTCSPARRASRATRFWRVYGAWNGFGPASWAKSPLAAVPN